MRADRLLDFGQFFLNDREILVSDTEVKLDAFTFGIGSGTRSIHLVDLVYEAG